MVSSLFRIKKKKKEIHDRLYLTIYSHRFEKRYSKLSFVNLISDDPFGYIRDKMTAQFFKYLKFTYLGKNMIINQRRLFSSFTE